MLLSAKWVTIKQKIWQKLTIFILAILLFFCYIDYGKWFWFGVLIPCGKFRYENGLSSLTNKRLVSEILIHVRKKEYPKGRKTWRQQAAFPPCLRVQNLTLSLSLIYDESVKTTHLRVIYRRSKLEPFRSECSHQQSSIISLKSGWMKCGGILGSVRAQQDEDMELSVSAVSCAGTRGLDSSH